MIISKRKTSKELLFYRALSFRDYLSEQEGKKLSVLERGYEGECIYDKVFEQTSGQTVLVFRDIYLKIEDSVAQYDSLIVSDGEITVNEIKNFSGLYRFENDKWYIRDFEVPDDPVSQLKRAMNKLKRLSYGSPLNFKVSGKLVFPHVEFSLQTSDRALQDIVIMHSGLRGYLKEFQNMYAGRHAEAIAAAVSKHIIENPYFDKKADFERVRKGVYCGKCGSFELRKSHYYLNCGRCGCQETKETHMLRAMSDFKALFLEDRMTKQKFMRFINCAVSGRTAQRMLNKYCERIDQGSHTYYLFRYHDFDEAYGQYEGTYRYKDKRMM